MLRGELPAAWRVDAGMHMIEWSEITCRIVDPWKAEILIRTQLCCGDFSRWRCSRARNYIDLAGATESNTIVISSHSCRDDQTAQNIYFAIFDNVCDICSAFVTQMQIPRWRGKHVRNLSKALLQTHSHHSACQAIHRSALQPQQLAHHKAYTASL